MSREPSVSRPLTGVRVLDLSRVLAGPWATQALADLGAEVLKVERPDGGDDTRSWGPPWPGAPGDRDVGAAYYLSTNRGKRSLTVDLSTPEGQARVRRLAAVADVVVENFKPACLERWGLTAEALHAVNPRLVVCSISGFGRTGPSADRPGYDLLVQAMGGLMSITGASDGPPTKVGVAVADLMTGMYATTGILAALREAERTGRGRHVEVSLLDTQVAWLANQGLNALVSGEAPARRGNAHPNIVPYETFEAADGHLVVACGNDRQFRALAAVLGEPAWADDPRFATNAARVRHREDLVPRLAERLAARTRAHWEAALGAVGVPCGPVRDVREALTDEALLARGAVATHEHAALGAVRTLAGPVYLDGTRQVAEQGPPSLGEGGEVVAERWLASPSRES